MSAKKVSFGTQPKPAPAVTPEQWVESRAVEGTKRLTIDLPASLHRHVKAECARRGAKMADVIRDLLKKEFPES